MHRLWLLVFCAAMALPLREFTPIAHRSFLPDSVPQVLLVASWFLILTGSAIQAASRLASPTDLGVRLGTLGVLSVSLIPT